MASFPSGVRLREEIIIFVRIANIYPYTDKTIVLWYYARFYKDKCIISIKYFWRNGKILYKIEAKSIHANVFCFLRIHTIIYGSIHE